MTVAVAMSATAGVAAAVSVAAFGGEAATADTTFGSCTVCSTAPPPPTSVPTTFTTSTPTTSAPPPDTRPPGRPKYLHAVTKVPGAITLRWVRPDASDLAGIVVRRGPGACPASPRSGVQIGGTAPRETQTDTGEADTHTYCYVVYAYDWSGNYSTAAVVRHVRNPGDVTPPPPVADLTATLTGAHHVALRWVNPARAGVRAIVVRRGVGEACPTGPESGAAVGGRAPGSGRVDLVAKPGSTYCYGVFAIDAAGNASVATVATVAILAAATPPPKRPVAVSGGSSGGWLTSTLVRAVAAAGLVMALLAMAAAVTVRRRAPSAYSPGRTAGSRLALAGYSPVGLVIPALVAVALAAVALFLLNP